MMRQQRRCAGVVELVDAPDSKSGSVRSVGSIPTARTTDFPWSVLQQLRRMRCINAASFAVFSSSSYAFFEMGKDEGDNESE